MIEYELADFVCQHCREIFPANLYGNFWCAKCGAGHILCPACKAVHQLSAAEQDRYWAGLEEGAK